LVNAERRAVMAVTLEGESAVAIWIDHFSLLEFGDLTKS
jgi:hypothetical protein